MLKVVLFHVTPSSIFKAFHDIYINKEMLYYNKNKWTLLTTISRKYKTLVPSLNDIKNMLKYLFI